MTQRRRPSREAEAPAAVAPAADVGPAKGSDGPKGSAQPVVALARAREYDPPTIRRVVADLLEATNAWATLTPGSRVLVKPNLISADQRDGLACTHPQVVRAAVELALDAGCTPVVADSPAFGMAARVAQKVGMTAALADLGPALRARSLEDPVRTQLPCGVVVGLARLALESDAVLNLPRLKAHKQARVTGAVKNCFGTAVGVRKPVLHCLHGERGADGHRFEQALLEIMLALPPMVSLMDGVVAMHVSGPIRGEPCPTGFLAASPSAVALDAVVCAMLGLTPEAVPLWAEARRRGLPGARPEEIVHAGPAGLTPDDFDLSGFRLPQTLLPFSFDPLQLARGACRRALARLR